MPPFNGLPPAMRRSPTGMRPPQPPNNLHRQAVTNATRQEGSRKRKEAPEQTDPRAQKRFAAAPPNPINNNRGAGQQSNQRPEPVMRNTLSDVAPSQPSNASFPRWQNGTIIYPPSYNIMNSSHGGNRTTSAHPAPAVDPMNASFGGYRTESARPAAPVNQLHMSYAGNNGPAARPAPKNPMNMSYTGHRRPAARPAPPVDVMNASFGGYPIASARPAPPVDVTNASYAGHRTSTTRPTPAINSINASRGHQRTSNAAALSVDPTDGFAERYGFSNTSSRVEDSMNTSFGGHRTVDAPAAAYDAMNASFGGYRTQTAVPTTTRPEDAPQQDPHSPARTLLPSLMPRDQPTRQTLPDNMNISSRVYATMNNPSPMSLLTQSFIPRESAPRGPPPVGVFEVPGRRQQREQAARGQKNNSSFNRGQGRQPQPPQDINGAAPQQPVPAMNNGSNVQQAQDDQAARNRVNNLIINDISQSYNHQHPALTSASAINNSNITNNDQIVKNTGIASNQTVTEPGSHATNSNVNLNETYDPIILAQLDDLLGPIEAAASTDVPSADSTAISIPGSRVASTPVVQAPAPLMQARMRASSMQLLRDALQGTKRKRVADAIDLTGEDSDGPGEKRPRREPATSGDQNRGVQHIREAQVAPAQPARPGSPEWDSPKGLAGLFKRSTIFKPTAEHPCGKIFNKKFFDSENEFVGHMHDLGRILARSLELAHDIVDMEPGSGSMTAQERYGIEFEMINWPKQRGRNFAIYLTRGLTYGQAMMEVLPDQLSEMIQTEVVHSLMDCGCEPAEYLLVAPPEEVRKLKDFAVRITKSKFELAWSKVFAENTKRQKMAKSTPEEVERMLAAEARDFEKQKVRAKQAKPQQVDMEQGEASTAAGEAVPNQQATTKSVEPHRKSAQIDVSEGYDELEKSAESAGSEESEDPEESDEPDEESEDFDEFEESNDSDDSDDSDYAPKRVSRSTQGQQAQSQQAGPSRKRALDDVDEEYDEVENAEETDTAGNPPRKPVEPRRKRARIEPETAHDNGDSSDDSVKAPERSWKPVDRQPAKSEPAKSEPAKSQPAKPSRKRALEDVDENYDDVDDSDDSVRPQKRLRQSRSDSKPAAKKTRGAASPAELAQDEPCVVISSDSEDPSQAPATHAESQTVAGIQSFSAQPLMPTITEESDEDAEDAEESEVLEGEDVEEDEDVEEEVGPNPGNILENTFSGEGNGWLNSFLGDVPGMAEFLAKKNNRRVARSSEEHENDE